jgi:microcystin-dependent protein
VSRRDLAYVAHWDLTHLGGLSDERTIPLLLSPRSLYILQNLADLDVLDPRRYDLEPATVPQHPAEGTDEYGLFLSSADAVGVELSEEYSMWAVGDIRMVGADYNFPDEEPYAWLYCDGSEVSQELYPALYDFLGETWGSAGEGYFKLPDLRNRSPQGHVYGQDEPGDLVGTKMQTNVPQHDHDVLGRLTSGGASARFFNASSGSFFTGTTELAGEAAGVDQRGPRATVVFVVKT